MHETDRVVQLVRDARDELAERAHLLALHQLRLGIAQLARALVDARFERLVELRDLVEGLGVLDRDRRLVGERQQQLAIVGGEALARRLAPDRDTPSRSTPKSTGTSNATSRRSKSSSQATRMLRVGLVGEVAARDFLAPHPQVLADGMIGGELDLVVVQMPAAAARGRHQRALVVGDQQHHRALDAHRIRERAHDALDDLLDREHRHHRLGDLAHGLAVATALAVEEAIDSACMRSRSGFTARIAKNRKTSVNCGERAFQWKRTTAASAPATSSA